MKVEIKEIEQVFPLELAAIFLACLKHDYQGILPATVLNNFSLEDSEELWNESVTSVAPHNFIGAYIAGELVGFSKIGIDPEDSAAGYLASLYVHPDASGKGVGKKLLSYSLEELSGDPITRLWVFGSNEKAIELYKSLGFTVNGRSRTQSTWNTLEIELELNNTK